MKSQNHYLTLPALLLAFLFVQAPFASADPALPRPQLEPETRSSLVAAAEDSLIQPWQRRFMLGLAQDADPAPGIQPATPTVSGTAAEDGAWTPILPSSVTGHTAIYDPLRNRMIVFGGSYRNDVWVLTLSGEPTWSVIAVGGEAPMGRRRQKQFSQRKPS